MDRSIVDQQRKVLQLSGVQALNVRNLINKIYIENQSVTHGAA